MRCLLRSTLIKSSYYNAYQSSYNVKQYNNLLRAIQSMSHGSHSHHHNNDDMQTEKNQNEQQLYKVSRVIISLHTYTHNVHNVLTCRVLIIALTGIS